MKMRPSFLWPAATLTVTGLVAFAAAVLLLTAPDPASAAFAHTFTVNSTGDAPDATAGDNACDAGGGVCTLRAAIQQANASVGEDLIDFAIVGPGVRTIFPVSALPGITGATTIDGYTQPGAAVNTNGSSLGTSAALRVELDGSSAGASARGLEITGPGVVVRGLIINNFGDDGIHISGPGGAVIEGNFIGTGKGGLGDHGNGDDGVQTTNSPNNRIGGTSPAARNVISGNDAYGIFIAGAGSTGNLVQGNLIGTDASGATALGNTFNGVGVQGAPGNMIGGEAVGAGNVISGNEIGIAFALTGSADNNVRGNLIGTQVDGVSPLPNTSHGVLFVVGAHDNTIGGEAEARQNVIAYNGGDGVFLRADAGVSNYIDPNVMYANAGLGIDLGADGVDTNDAGDADAGPNDLQNYPVIASATITGSVSIEGTLNSRPNVFYNLFFFANAECDPSGFGEGRRFLGDITMATDANGNLQFSAHLGAAVLPGEFITATASNPESTSEFSKCVTAQAAVGTASPTPSPTATPTATPTPTPTPGATPTPTATPPEVAKGDVDCDDDVDSIDGLKDLRDVAGLPVAQNEPCPDIGSEVASLFGDMDCDDDVDAVDALKLLQHVSQLPVPLPPGCAPIGV